MSESDGQKLAPRPRCGAGPRRQRARPLEFDEIEKQMIEQAVIAADRAEVLRQVFDDELAGERRSSALARFRAERARNRRVRNERHRRWAECWFPEPVPPKPGDEPPPFSRSAPRSGA
jgi:hypothetical protein